ncbi:MAG TPA: hypothetical protein VF392_06890 [Terracidiphilus sp.]
MTRKQQWRGAALCVAIYLGCLLIAWPVAEMGYDDDWSYIRTAQVLAQTGHFIYTGWSNPILGWQAIWGELFIKLFGFSFTAVKLSTVPIAAVTIVLFHAILLRFGITSRNSIIATLTLALSPLFMPLSVSFMTDLYGLFIVVASLYLCKRALDARATSGAMLWLCLATLTSLVGGTARQTGWLGALVLVPSCGWILRKRRTVLAASLALGAISLISVILCMAWMRHQPYWASNDLLDTVTLGWAMRALLTLYELGGGTISLLIIIVPVLVIWIPEIRQVSRQAKITYVYVVCLAALMQLIGRLPLPWVLHTMQLQFTSQRVSAFNPIVSQSGFVELSIAFFTVIILAASSAVCLHALLRRWHHGGDSVIGKQLFWLCAPLTAAYVALLLPRALHALIFDRYMLLLAPIAILCLAHLYQCSVSPKMPAGAIALLVLMASISVAGTHDIFAWQRARLAAIAELTAAGVPPTSFYGGVECDGWTQIEHGGHINSPWLTNPPDAYTPQPPVIKDDPCAHGFAPYVPSIHAEYTIVFEPKPCFEPSRFPSVSYISWIPPFRRTIYVQRIPESRRR